MKVVINSCYGGFSLSDAATLALRALRHKVALDDRLAGERYPTGEIATVPNSHCHDIERNDPLLIQGVESLGDRANGAHAKLKIVEIPDDVDWEIAEYDGLEHVAQKHRTWG
jgi:hypothetical protein